MITLPGLDEMHLFLRRPVPTKTGILQDYALTKFCVVGLFVTFADKTSYDKFGVPFPVIFNSWVYRPLYDSVLRLLLFLRVSGSF